MLTLLGTPALSAFRLQQLQLEIQKIAATVNAITANFIHFVDVNADLSPIESKNLTRLLAYGDTEAINNNTLPAQVLYVIPRIGTISPWSSKATEITQRCGLTNILRLERGVQYNLVTSVTLNTDEKQQITSLIHDRMTQTVVTELTELNLFSQQQPQALTTFPVLSQGAPALELANTNLGLALSSEEINYLTTQFQQLQRDPTDVELMMFAQANSEHCRHKIFNADWTIDSVPQAMSLFSMIRHTSSQNPHGILTAYSDNSSVINGAMAQVLIRDPNTGEYAYVSENAEILMKVETHNHPTAISPYAGAATGSGGEIRDEAATGRGSHTKAGLTGFSVSHLKIPNCIQAWETEHGKPERIASALDIMLDAPLGSAAFNNEFGRPNLTGYFRTFEYLHASNQQLYGYHKPIMLAGGMGNIRPMLVHKQAIPADSLIIILGGPAMLIGLGGGAASSQTSGSGDAALDFASVQRENPEMERRCQEVINHCNALGEHSPIISIHDVGAGGLSNAVPEIIHDCNKGGKFELRRINNADLSLSPMQIWSNEAQERYVVAIAPESLNLFSEFCQREQCLYAVIGTVTEAEHLSLSDELLGTSAIDLPMEVLFGKTPSLHRQVETYNKPLTKLDLSAVTISAAVERVLKFPAVADKSFLIHIGDRSVTGLVARDQMVGPWQIPVADVAVTTSGFKALTGEAMAIGERAPVALINAPASGRMALAEAITNIAAAQIDSIEEIKLSANWMAAAGSKGADAELFATAQALALELCPNLGIAIPVGKDSLSMQTVWEQTGQQQNMTAPLSLIISAFAPVEDVSKTLTPQLRQQDSVLLLIDLGQGKNRLGGSTLAQVYNQLGNECPDLNTPNLLKDFFGLIQDLNQHDLLLAYHDRADGGLFTTLAEMLFASRLGLDINLDSLGSEHLSSLFNEELGAVIQIPSSALEQVNSLITNANLIEHTHQIGTLNSSQELKFSYQNQLVYAANRSELQQLWSTVSYNMQALRDNPSCALQEFEQINNNHNLGLSAKLSFDLNQNIVAHLTTTRPKVAILREQGVNGHVEMAAAFNSAGFTSIDVHMSDIISGRISLTEFKGLAVCGGFSYGDVLGAGGGWAKSILFNQRARNEFASFFQRKDTFGLGVCNGCQMLAALKELIPGATHWPEFKRNVSEQFEARVSMVKIAKSPAILFSGMEGSMLPVVIAHGEGRAEFADAETQAESIVALNYVDHTGKHTTEFPANPNGSPAGITGLTTTDGRFTIMMPHPERCFRAIQNSWYPDDWNIDGAWLRMFRNARLWVAEQV